MKYLITVIVLVLFIIGSFGNIDGFSHNTSHPSLPEVSLQLQLRNSDGQLIAYIEPTTMYITNLEKIHERLDSENIKSKVMKGDKEYEQIEIQSFYTFTENLHGQMASFNLYWEQESILAYRHDGYLAEPGDTLIAYWKILRVVD